MANFQIIDEHHELVTSLGVYLTASSQINSLGNTILHFDSHSDVGHIKTLQPLSPEFVPNHSELLEYLNVGNPFTLLFYYRLISDFYWFSPGEQCHEICQPFVFSVEHERDEPIHFYKRQLTSCLDTIFDSRKLNLPTYRKVSIDSDENLAFLWSSFDYALIDTGLRSVIGGKREFVLDICYDYFYANSDHIASPMTISITEEYYQNFIADPLHPLKLRLGPIARVTHDQTGFKLDIGGFESKISSHFSDSSDIIEIIKRRLFYFEKFLRSLKSPPLSIYLCRSSISNYTPKPYINYIEDKLLQLLQSLDFAKP
jgi:hypothetical protein